MGNGITFGAFSFLMDKEETLTASRLGRFAFVSEFIETEIEGLGLGWREFFGSVIHELTSTFSYHTHTFSHTYTCTPHNLRKQERDAETFKAF